jgi:hypothetical protein
LQISSHKAMLEDPQKIFMRLLSLGRGTRFFSAGLACPLE